MIRAIKQGVRKFVTAPNIAFQNLKINGITIVRDKASAEKALKVLSTLNKRYTIILNSGMGY